MKKSSSRCEIKTLLSLGPSSSRPKDLTFTPELAEVPNHSHPTKFPSFSTKQSPHFLNYAGRMTILTNPLFRPLLELVRLSRNGIVYGGKLRFSHALVINLLYRSGPLKPRLQQVLKATQQHSIVLAAFAMVYKSVCHLLQQEKALGNNTGLVKLVAGAFAGWVVYSQNFGYFNPGITHQITLYCFSRVLIAVGKILLDFYLQCRQPRLRIHGEMVKFDDLTAGQSSKFKTSIYNKSWKYFAVLTWGLVMFIFDYQPQYLQSSLRHSMSYIYDVEMDSWSTWREFFGLF